VADPLKIALIPYQHDIKPFEITAIIESVNFSFGLPLVKEEACDNVLKPFFVHWQALEHIL